MVTATLIGVGIVESREGSPPICAEQTHELVEDGFRIKVFFRLIDDKRTVIPLIGSKIKEQEYDTAGFRKAAPGDGTLRGQRGRKNAARFWCQVLQPAGVPYS